jgi:hypothetical protein
MKTKIWLCAFLILSVIATRAEELALNSGDGSAVATRVAQLVAAGDYAGVARVSDEIESQARGVHDITYFRDLLGLLAGLTHDTGIELTYAHRWAIRKVQWKIVLTKHSHPQDAHNILKMKNSLLRIGLSPQGLSSFADEDQFVALRLDAAALLWSYRDSLGQWIIPNYQPKAMKGQSSGIKPATKPVDPAAAAQADAQARLREIELTRNKWENMEQIELNDALRQLNSDASWLIIHDFTWPPEDDATVTKLLDTFPPEMFSRDQMLEKVAAMQRYRLQEYGMLKEKAAAALQKAK